MPVRRSRAEQLVLVPADGKPVVTLFTETRGRGELTTQDVFQVSPDGAFLAYAARGALRVRAAAGSERAIEHYDEHGLMRFSPDGKRLAAVVAAKTSDGDHRLVVFDLADGTTRELAASKLVHQLEWIEGSLVVHGWDAARQQDVLVEHPLAGGRHLLLAGALLDRFVAAATGTRIVAFLGNRAGTATSIVAFDVAAPAATRELGVVHDPITNAAASLDGQRVAFTTALAVFTITGDARPQAISSRDHVHSLWFAHDGRLGYASETSATILDGKHAHRFDGDGPIRMLRFDPISQRALVTATHAWDAAAAAPQRLATPSDGRDLIGVDHFAGGLVVWSSRLVTQPGIDP